MRFLADENIPGIVVSALRQEGDDITWSAEGNSGASDLDILKRAVEERRVLLTLDTDFGTLIYHYGHPASVGVLLFRVEGMVPHDLVELVLSARAQREDWAGCMAVVGPDQIRIRSLPQ